MPLKPWYEVVKPRADLREGKPLDTSEFAVHLDRVRDGTARDDYGKPDQFFAKTFLAANLLDLSAQTARRLAGETTHTSPVFNLATNFGGGKTHALTLLYHLAKHGPASHGWLGVSQILEKAAIPSIPAARLAVFVGCEFDSISGRGGDDGTPRRHTPWGEIAFQLAGPAGFALVREHDEKRIAPGGDVIRKLLPADQPCLILVDELMNYISRFRSLGLNHQLYDFLFNLSGAINPRSVLVVSIPKSEDEMTAEDEADFQRLSKMLDRVGKAIRVTAGTETSEIIRRRLFEWDTRAVSSDGKVIIPTPAADTCHEYARWLQEQAGHLSNAIPQEHARVHFEASYPFHPCVLSVFERKWQTVPKFQQTRGVLRMLAQWVQDAYSNAYRKAHPDPLITLGTAPMENPMFRAAVFEQLGNRNLETAVTVDIAGRKDAHAATLDAEAVETIKNERLHKKVATAVFFESNGGTTRSEATVPEIRLAVGHPGLDLGNIETALDALTEKSYYLTVERKNYKFSLKENLNKRFSDKRASLQAAQTEEIVRQEIQRVFIKKEGVDCLFFPERSNEVADRPSISFLVLSPARTMEDAPATLAFVDQIIREYGSSSRVFKSALVAIVAESVQPMQDEARKLLAWQAIQNEADDLKLDEVQKRQLTDNVSKARRDLRESVWRAYKHLLLLGKDNKIRQVDLGLVHSSAAADMATLVLNRLKQDGDIEAGISPQFLVRNWPAMKEWATKSVRDAFFATPKFPRLLSAEAVKETIQRGVMNGQLAYVGKTASGDYQPFHFNSSLMTGDIEFSDDMFIITKETAEAYLTAKTRPIATGPSGEKPVGPPTVTPPPIPGEPPQPSPQPSVKPGALSYAAIAWSGEVPAQKWMNFYTRVLSKFASGKGLTLKLTFEVRPEDGLTQQKVEETKSALRELGLDDNLDAR